MTRLRSNPWLVLLVLCLGFFMILLDTTIVNIAIPSIIDDLKAPLDQIVWVLNAYILVYAVLLITAGRLGDMVGPRLMFALGLAVFTIASALCGLAQDTNQLIAARVLQGVGGALLTPQTLTILTTIFPPERRGAAFGVWGGVAGIAAVTGPTLGGLIVTYVNWRWIFYVNVPIGIFALAATFLIVPDLRPGRRQGLDPVGVVLATVGLFALTFGLIEGQRYDWGVITGWLTIPVLIGAGILVLVAFVVWERYQESPLIPLSLFADRNFSVANWIRAAVAFGMLGLFLPFVIYLQSVRGMTALEAGLTVVPMSLVSIVVAPIAGQLSDRLGGKYILMLGTACFGVGMGLLTWLAGPTSDWRTFLIPLLIAGVGIGCTFAPMVTVAMRNISPQMAGAASGVLNTSRQLGGVIGSAVVGAVLQAQLARALHEEAVRRSVSLPEAFRQRFIDAFDGIAKGGLQVGRGQTGGAQQLPPGIPPQVAAQIQQAFHDTFVYAFINAMRPTMLVPVAVLLIGALSCLLIKRRVRTAAPARELEAAS
jgi:EmrB/QacA subfamily drug resistance transporter